MDFKWKIRFLLFIEFKCGIFSCCRPINVFVQEEESQEHMMVCTGWEEERGSLDMLRIMDQVEFFIKVGKVKTIK